MTEQKYGDVWEIDHVYPLSKTNISYKNERNKRFNCINLRPMSCSENNSKQNKNDHRLCLLQEIEGKYFLKLNDQKGLNEIFH